MFGGFIIILGIGLIIIEPKRFPKKIMLDNLQEYFETPIEIVFKKRKTISIQVKPNSIRFYQLTGFQKNQ